MKKEIKIPKLKKLKIRGYRKLTKINGKIVNASMSKEANGKYYVSVLYKIENNRYIKKYEKRIQRKQKELSRKEKGKKFYQINEYYVSSQICSRCENKDKKYKDLKKREDRDVNASINIMFEGLRLYIKEAFSIV